MRIEIPYGKDGVQTVEIPEKNLMAVVHPNDVEPADPIRAISYALDNPINSLDFKEFISGAENIVFIVNDGTRPTPTRTVLEVISRHMDLTFPRYLIATGSHREPTYEEYKMIFGRFYESLIHRVHSHDSKRDRVVYLGKTRNGTEMWINEMAVDADGLVIITSVEPHYFAGYTGGRKSILPGIAGYETIEQNHRLAMRPEAQSLLLDGNPVHEDMVDALKVMEDKPIFSIQIVMDRHHNVYRVVAGNLSDAFDRAVAWAREVFCVDVGEKADAIITVAPYPMDIDLYQSQKALDNAKWALEKGGKMILVSKCRDGIGHDTFFRQLSMSNDPYKILENLEKEYRLGYHKAAKMAEILTWADIWAVTDLDPDLLRKANIRPFSNVQDAVDELLAENPEARILVLMDGSVTVPRVE